MHIVIKVLIGIVIIGGAYLSLTPGKQKISKEYRPHVYYYYPKANMYYDSTEDTYINWDSVEHDWKISSNLPVNAGEIGRSVKIDHPADPVWSDNSNHRMIYAVSLYTSKKDLKKEQKNDGRVAVRTVDKQASAEKEKKRSGIRKFFDRLFAKKKD